MLPGRACDKAHLGPNLQFPFKKYLQIGRSVSREWLKGQFSPAVQVPFRKNLQGTCCKFFTVLTPFSGVFLGNVDFADFFWSSKRGSLRLGIADDAADIETS